MHLDLLQNPPLTDINLCLLNRKTQNIPPISQAIFKQNQQEIRTLSAYFGGEDGGNFSFSSGDFLELFIKLRDYKIAFAISNHQQAYQAYKLAKDLCHFYPIAPQRDTGIITDLPTCDVYMIPYINQDLLTYNPIAKLQNEILTKNPNALMIIDISYALARGETLDFKLCPQSIFLCDGESLGFLRGYGVFLTSSKNCSLFPPTRYIDGFYTAFLSEIKKRESSPKIQDQKEQVFEYLKQKLKEDVDLFAPLDSAMPNTLALRLKNIKARNLLQSLFLDQIFGINGQECLFGFSSPSFVLQEMGYIQDQARELLSLSFDAIPTHILDTLILHYQNLRNLEI